MLFALPAAYAAGDAVQIRARQVEINEKTGIAVYRGNVVVTQGDLTLKADRVEVRTRQGKADIIDAAGHPATARQRSAAAGEPETQIEASRMKYRVNDRQLDLEDNVVMRQGEDEINAARAHYDVNAGRLEAGGDETGGERVTAVIHPKQEPSPP